MRRWSILERVMFAALAVAFLLLPLIAFGDELPPPTIDAPLASIDISDARGLPIVDEAQLGKLLIVSAGKAIHGGKAGSLLWVIEPSVQTWTSPDGSTVLITTPLTPSTIKIMQLVAKGDRVAWQRLEVKCGKGAQPPPPGPTPPNPDPAPVKPTKLTLVVIEDVLQRSPTTAKVINATETWAAFRADGHQTLFFDRSTQGPGKRFVVEAGNKPLPVLLIRDAERDKLIEAVPLPKSVGDLNEAVEKAVNP